MKKLMLLALILVWSQQARSQFATQKLSNGMQVRFYKNIEFLSFVFFMGSMADQYENSEETFPNGVKKKYWHGYDLSLSKRYRSFKEDANLKTITRYAENYDGSHLFQFLIALQDFPNAHLNEIADERTYSFFAANNKEEAQKHAEKLIDALNAGYQTLSFEKYFSDSLAVYKSTIKDIEHSLPNSKIIAEMERFYRSSFGSYTLLPSLTLPAGMAFGGSEMRNGTQHIFNVFGPFGMKRIAGIDKPFFADTTHLQELSIHEFGHSFVNHVVYEAGRKDIDSAQSLFEPIKARMEDQGYNDWVSCLCEHFVRAGEVMVARNLKRTKAAERLKEQYMNDRKFIYLPIILRHLEAYDKNSKQSYAQTVKNAIQELVQLAKGN